MPVATIAADVTAAVAAHVAASNPHSQYFLASGVSAYGATLIDDADAATARTTLGLGTAAGLNVGTSAGNVVQLDGSARLPAVDGSQLTGITATASPGGSDTQLQYNNAGVLAGASGITRTGSGVLQLATRLVAPVWRPASDSTTALQLQTAGGTPFLYADTTNRRWQIGQFYPAPINAPLQVQVDGTGRAFVLSYTATEYTDFISGGALKGMRGTGTVPFTIQNTGDVFIATGGGIERLRVKSNGLVGIGTNSPNSLLDVAGTVQCDGLRIDATPTAGTPIATHTAIVNFNGTNYKILLASV